MAYNSSITGLLSSNSHPQSLCATDLGLVTVNGLVMPQEQTIARVCRYMRVKEVKESVAGFVRACPALCTDAGNVRRTCHPQTDSARYQTGGRC